MATTNISQAVSIFAKQLRLEFKPIDPETLIDAYDQDGLVTNYSESSIDGLRETYQQASEFLEASSSHENALAQEHGMLASMNPESPAERELDRSRYADGIMEVIQAMVFVQWEHRSDYG